MKQARTAYQVANMGWMFVCDGNGSYPNDQIQAACAMETVRLLGALISRFDSLGDDGIHEVIREVRRKQKSARRKSKAIR